MAWSLAGPAVFALGANIGGRIEPGYRPRDEPISALAAHGTRSAKVMVPAFFGLAAGTVGFASQLRDTATAPAPVPALLAAVGLAVAGAGVARCSDRSCPTRWLGDTDCRRTDDLHAAFGAIAFPLWAAIPVVAARRATAASDRYRRWSRRLGWSTSAALMVNGLLARRPSERWSGVAQRVTLGSAFAWYALAGAAS